MTTFPPKRSANRSAAVPARQAPKASARWLAPVCAAAVVPVVVAGAVVYLANQRGEEIARERAERAEQIAAGKVVQAFATSRGVLVMRDGSRRELVGAKATLLTTKPVAGQRLTWLALGRAADGSYFGQRFGANAQGEVRPVTEAQEVAAEVALGELRAQIAASGADAEAAQPFIQAATTGGPVAVGR